MNASAMHPHLVAADLAITIADESCRVLIETRARYCISTCPKPVYDVSALEPTTILDEEMDTADLEALRRAVRYLDLRGLLVRPVAGNPQYVSFAEAA
jgi:hypothetical protein